MGLLIASEVRKLVTTRLWLWVLLAALAITALYASLLIGFSEDPATWTLPLSTPYGKRTLFATAAGAAAPLAAVLGAVGMTGEYRHGTATATFLSTPRRHRVVAAKAVVYAGIGAAYGLACLGAVAAIAVPWLSARGLGVPLLDSGLPGTYAGVVAAVALYALVGIGLGALLRDQVATVVGLLVYLLVVEPILTGISALDAWTAYLPGPAQSALTGITLTTQDFLDPWHGGLVLAGYVAVLVAAGLGASIRRDIA